MSNWFLPCSSSPSGRRVRFGCWNLWFQIVFRFCLICSPDNGRHGQGALFSIIACVGFPKLCLSSLFGHTLPVQSNPFTGLINGFVARDRMIPENGSIVIPFPTWKVSSTMHNSKWSSFHNKSPDFHESNPPRCKVAESRAEKKQEGFGKVKP